MARENARPMRPMRHINKAAIVAAAFAVLEEAGLSGLTVRAVAAKLDVQAPALYWHVRNKQDLLDEMSTELWRRILAQIDFDREQASWRDGLRAFAHAIRHTLLSVRDGAKVFGGAYMTDTAILLNQEDEIAALTRQGFDSRGVGLAWNFVYSFTLGFCIEEQDMRQRVNGEYDIARRDQRVDAATHPLVAQVGHEIFADRSAIFEELLEAALQAAERFRTSPSTPSAPSTPSTPSTDHPA